jgi:TonB family protein
MTESVTDIIVARSRASEPLSSMVVWSALGHALLITVGLFVGVRAVDRPSEPVMTISLGGAPGPRTGGLTQIGAKAVQAPQPTQAPQVARPPAPAPRPTLPEPRSRPRAQATPTQAPPESRSRQASTGPEPTEGSALVDTGVKRGQGFGLSSAGGGGGALQVDVANFCCPDYLTQVSDVITRAWDQNQGVTASTGVKFTIQRSGAITAPQVEFPSGFIALDSSAMRALQLARLPPLPAAFQNPTLTVHMRFDYRR